MDYWLCVSVCMCVYVFSRVQMFNVQMLRASLSEISGYFTSMYGPNGNISSSLLIVYNTVPCSAPLRTRLNISEWNCLAVHWMGALWVMSAGPNEDYQGMAYHPALRHAQDVSAVSQSPLSERTQRVEHWRCSRMPIVLASDDMQALAVEAVDTAHHCASLQQSTSMPRTNVSMWNTLLFGMFSFPMPERVGGRPRCLTMSSTSSALVSYS